MTITARETTKKELYRTIDEMERELADVARKIHEHPEIAFRELYAVDLLADAADKAGFTVERNLGGLETAFQATLAGDREGPVVVFLAEYDALPDIGHACGHNLIAAGALGAAIATAAALDPIPGELRLVGTPAEEEGGGKVILAREGVFDDAGAVIMFHPANRNQLWKYAMASNVVEMEFLGKAAHSASAPEHGINALDATILTFNNINALRQHVKQDVRIHGVIQSGGSAPNIVPDYSSALFYVRSLDDEYCAQVVEKVQRCAEGAAMATGATLEFHDRGGYRTLKTNHHLTDAFEANMAALGVKFGANAPLDDIGSTDLGDVSHIVPCIHPYVAIGDTTIDYHSPEFARAACSPEGYRAMLLAAKAMGATAVDYFLDSGLRNRVEEEFRA